MCTRVFAVLICTVVLAGRGLYAEPLHLVKQGKPQATIIIAANAGNYQKWAAGWLSDYVRNASGAKLPIVVETTAPAGTLISIGHTEMAKRAAITTDDLRYDGCKLIVKGKVLYLIGRDSVPLPGKRPNFARSGPQGTVRAVVTFLEEVVGVRWFLPGPEGTVVPSTRDISVSDSLSKTFVPAMAYCEGRSPYKGNAIANFAGNFRTAIKYLSYGGHSWEVHVPDKEHFKDHPEYFALLPGGKRSRATYSKTGLLVRNSHLCTSNPQVRQIMVEKIRAEFDKGHDMVQLGQSDGWQPCLCPECMKMDDHRSGGTVTRDKPCEKIWLMHKWILDELMKTHPDKLVNVMVYGPTKWPSKKFDSLPTNAVTEMAPITPQRLEAWQGKIRKLTTYLYWWEDNCNASGFVPPVSPEWLQKTLRQYRDLGVIGIKGTPRVNWGLGGPSYYAYGKLMADPDANIDRLLDEYCMGVYGDAGRIMKRFFKLFHSRSGRTRELAYFPNSYPAEDAFTALYPPKIVRELDRLLTKAETKARTERDKQWVKHTRDCFDGLKAIAGMFAVKRFFELEPTRENLLRVKARIETFEAWRARILSYDEAYTTRWFPDYYPMAAHLMTGGGNGMFDEYYYGYPLTRKHVQAVRLGKKVVRGTGIGGDLGHNEIRAPITWDFDRIMANLGQPKPEKVVEVKYAARPPALDGRIGPEWKGVPTYAFEAYQSEGSKVTESATTTVRLLHDDQHLYVAYECVEPEIEKLKLKSVGRDGRVYGCDEVELFLNTDEKSDRKVMQFMASPIEDAFYDARKGFIEDVLNPNYNAWEVTSWNPGWRYAFNIDKPNKKWTIEIAVPFKSLGAPPPMPGTVWTGNFARCRRVHGDEDLSSWVPATFGGDPQFFGEIVFAGRPGAKKPVQGTPRKPTPAQAPAPKKHARKYVKNSSFEDVAQGKPVSWGIQSYPQANVQEMLKHCAVTTEKAHTGKRSFKIDFTDLEVDRTQKARDIILSQYLYQDALKPLLGKEAVFSMWVCYENLPHTPAGAYFPGPWVDFPVRAGGKTTGAAEMIVLGRPYLTPLGYVTDAQVLDKWIKIEKKLTLPADTEWLRIRGGLVGWTRTNDQISVNRTSLYIDDIRLEVVKE